MLLWGVSPFGQAIFHYGLSVGFRHDTQIGQCILNLVSPVRHWFNDTSLCLLLLVISTLGVTLFNGAIHVFISLCNCMGIHDAFRRRQGCLSTGCDARLQQRGFAQLELRSHANIAPAHHGVVILNLSGWIGPLGTLSVRIVGGEFHLVGYCRIASIEKSENSKSCSRSEDKSVQCYVCNCRRQLTRPGVLPMRMSKASQKVSNGDSPLTRAQLAVLFLLLVIYCSSSPLLAG